MSIPSFGSDEDEVLFAAEKKVLAQLKKAVLMIAGAAVQKFMMKLSHEQEILMNIADMIIEIYAAESTLLRVEKLIDIKGEEAVSLQKDMAYIYLNRAVEVCQQAGRASVFCLSPSIRGYYRSPNYSRGCT